MNDENKLSLPSSTLSSSSSLSLSSTLSSSLTPLVIIKSVTDDASNPNLLSSDLETKRPTGLDFYSLVKQEQARIAILHENETKGMKFLDVKFKGADVVLEPDIINSIMPTVWRKLSKPNRLVFCNKRLSKMISSDPRFSNSGLEIHQIGFSYDPDSGKFELPICDSFSKKEAKIHLDSDSFSKKEEKDNKTMVSTLDLFFEKLIELQKSDPLIMIEDSILLTLENSLSSVVDAKYTEKVKSIRESGLIRTSTCYDTYKQNIDSYDQSEFGVIKTAALGFHLGSVYYLGMAENMFNNEVGDSTIAVAIRSRLRFIDNVNMTEFKWPRELTKWDFTYIGRDDYKSDLFEMMLLRSGCETLDWGSNVDPWFLKNVKRFISSCITLKSVNFGMGMWNRKKWDNDILQQIAKSVASSPSIESLSFSDNGLCNDKFLLVLDSLNGCRLKSLNLFCCGLSAAVGPRFIEFINAHTNLNDVYIAYNTSLENSEYGSIIEKIIKSREK